MSLPMAFNVDFRLNVTANLVEGFADILLFCNAIYFSGCHTLWPVNRIVAFKPGALSSRVSLAS